MKKKFINNLIFIVIILNIFLFNFSACYSTKDQTNDAEKVFASVIDIEKYGHAVLNITSADFIKKGYALGDIVNVCFNSYDLNMPLFDGYYSIPGEFMLRASSPEENIAICINYGNFANEMGVLIGSKIEISMHQKAGMLSTQELFTLQYSNNRADYKDDATFANFRVVTLGNIGEGKLYRSASPINNKIGRAIYANNLIASVNVATIVNLGDSVEEMEQFINAEDFNSEYYLSLYEDEKVIAMNLTSNFLSNEFVASMVNGFRFIIENEPPYCLHCTEGNDRSGFMVMYLSALMGANLQEIIDDYMLSYYNYYGITKEKEPERYDAVLNNNIIAILYNTTGTNSIDELRKINLELSVTEHLLNAGLTENEILSLKEKLS